VGNHARFGDGPLVYGLNVRCRDTLATIQRAVERARKDGCEHICVAGDVFDYDRVEPAIETAMQDLILNSRLQWEFIVGNHDQTSGELNHNALSPLKNVAIVHEKPGHSNLGVGPTSARLFSIPFRPGRAEDWLESAMLDAGVAGAGVVGIKAMMIHLGVSDTQTPYYLDGANDSVSIGTLQRLMAKYDVRCVVAGNWHCQRRWSWTDSVQRHVVQVGTLAPVRFSDGGLAGFGSLAEWDTATNSFHFVEIPGPRWLTVDFAKLEELLWDLSHEGENVPYSILDHCAPLYVAAKVRPDEQETARGILDLMVKRSWVRAGEVTVQAEVVRENATTTIRAATQPASRIDVLRSYIDKAPIPPEVTREEVREFVLECVKGVL
jgi:hypothetical protein